MKIVRRYEITAMILLIGVVVGPEIVRATGIPESPEGAPGTITVTDALGREVQFPAAPQRIVAAGRAVLMTADALYAFPGAGERLVGVGRIDQGKGNFLRAIDDTYATKTILERNVGPEQVAALTPDVVILKTFMRESLGARLEEIGIPVVYIELETPQQYSRDLRTIGRLVDQNERAEELVGFFETERERIQETTDGIPPEGRPDVLFAYVQPGDTSLTFRVPAPSWIQTEMVRMAGGNPVWENDAMGGGWIQVNLEQILRWDPDHIFVVSYRNDIRQIVSDLQNDALFSQLSAVRSGKIDAVPVDFYSWDQPDVRWILGLAWMSRRLHPELFSEQSITDEVFHFYDFVYGMERAETEQVIFTELATALE